MAIQYLRNGFGNVFGEVLTVDAASVAVAPGNLIVVLACRGGAVAGDPTVTDSEGNSYTMNAAQDGSHGWMRTGYAEAASTHAANVVTATWGDVSSTRHEILVVVFSKDATATWSLTDSSFGSVYGTAPSSGNVSTTGTDSALVALARTNTGDASSRQIGGVAEDAGAQINFSFWWTRVIDAAATDVAATATMSGAAWVGIELLAFEALPGATSDFTKRTGVRIQF